MKVSLRRFATIALVAACVAALAAAVAAARTTRSAADIRNGGTLTIGLAEEPDALDPTLARTFVGRIVFLAMCEKLYDLDSHLNIVPQLATALPQVSKDKLTYTIKLRTGVKFNDGTAFNAAAVKTTLERDLTLKGSVRASEISPINTVDAPNATTVVLHLKSPYSPLTAQLADRAGMVLSPKALAAGGTFAQNPVCVGPFMYKDRVAGDHITLVKSPYYYDKAKVHLASVVYRIMTDPRRCARATSKWRTASSRRTCRRSRRTRPSPSRRRSRSATRA
jgi:peptide/nickel transport system substrate-binding protein